MKTLLAAALASFAVIGSAHAEIDFLRLAEQATATQTRSAADASGVDRTVTGSTNAMQSRDMMRRDSRLHREHYTGK